MPGPATSIAPRPAPASVCNVSSREIIGRVGEPGNPAGAPDQGDRLVPGQPRLGDLRGAAVAEVAGERLARAGYLLVRASQSARCRRPSVARGKAPCERRQVDPEAQLASRSAIALIRPARAARRPWSAATSARVVVADEVAQDVDLAPSGIRQSARPRRQLDAEPGRLGPGDGEGREGVVVGDRQRRQADARRRRLTTSQGEQAPSECVVCTWRSAATGRGRAAAGRAASHVPGPSSAGGGGSG